MPEVIKQSIRIEWPPYSGYEGLGMLRRIESAGRTCYRSEDKITEDSAIPFVRKILRMGHESVLEHASVSVRVICDRAISHEFVRHRLCAFSQESTRYVDSMKRGEIQVIDPRCSGFSCSDEDFERWLDGVRCAEALYLHLRAQGWAPQMARSVLPHCLKTEFVVTTNLREWRHIFKMRLASGAHPQFRDLMRDLLRQLQERIPVVFEDLGTIDV